MIRKSINNVTINIPTSVKSNDVSKVNKSNDNTPIINSIENVETYNVDYVELDATQDLDELIKINEENTQTINNIINQMNKEYQSLEEQYNDVFSLENSEVWYGNGIIMSNGERPMTPQEYENLLLGNYSQMYTDPNIVEAFYNDEEWQEKVRLYEETYNEIFKKLTNGEKSEEEYQEYMESIKNDSLMLSSSLYALKQEEQRLKTSKEEQDITNSEEYIKWSSNSELTIEQFETKYAEYMDKYGKISEVPNLAIEIEEEYNPMWFCEYAEKLASEEGLDINDVINKQIAIPQYDFEKLYQIYEVMTEEEIKIYSYLFETEGKERADEYLNKKQDELNQRIGCKEAEQEIAELTIDDEGKIKETLGNMLNVGTDGLKDGITSFFRGIENAIINNENITIEEYKIAYYLQYLEKNTDYLDNIYQVGMATGNMLPSVTASFLTSLVAPELAPKVGQTLMGVSAYGNSKHEALVNGYSTMTSVIYGLLSAGSEVLTEKMGGVLGLADNPSTSFIIRMLQEGNEEFIQSYLMAGIDAVILNKPINLDELTDEAIKSFLMGAIVAGNLNLYSGALGVGVNVIVNGKQMQLTTQQLTDLLNDNIDQSISDIYELSQIDDKELFSPENLPPSSDEKIRVIQEKYLRGEKISIMEMLYFRDNNKIVKELGDYELKPDHAYRVVSIDGLISYLQNGYVYREMDEYIPGENNGGVDWYLGAAAINGEYGSKDIKVIIECPAYEDYFELANSNGTAMVLDPSIRHLKSSSRENPIPFDKITHVFIQTIDENGNKVIKQLSEEDLLKILNGTIEF